MLHSQLAGESMDWLCHRKTSLSLGQLHFSYNFESKPMSKPIGLLDFLSRQQSDYCHKLKGVHLIAGNHSPWIMDSSGVGFTEKESNFKFDFEPDSLCIVSVGSVGQPRDGDPRAGYAIVDESSIVWRRIQYDVDGAIAAIVLNSELAPANAERLRNGV